MIYQYVRYICLVFAMCVASLFTNSTTASVGLQLSEVGAHTDPAPQSGPEMTDEERAKHGAPLPDGRVAFSSQGDIQEAWLSQPTDRYGHGVLGDRIEAGAVTARMSDGSLLTYALPKDSVFEDLQPRLGDLDGDGTTEVVLVRSYLDYGGSVSVLGLREGKLGLLAETQAIGIPNRWLNPSILADLDRSGRLSIGLVQTPHIGGQLQIWQFDGTALHLVNKANGFSNHSIGSRALGLSAVLWRGGESRLLIPDASQDYLLLLDGKDLTIQSRMRLPARPVSDFVVKHDARGKQIVEFGLANGRLYHLKDLGDLFFD